MLMGGAAGRALPPKLVSRSVLPIMLWCVLVSGTVAMQDLEQKDVDFLPLDHSGPARTQLPTAERNVQRQAKLTVAREKLERRCDQTLPFVDLCISRPHHASTWTFPRPFILSSREEAVAIEDALLLLTIEDAIDDATDARGPPASRKAFRAEG